jgi:5-methylcytosine-specific restriction endonuclease McrA
MKIDQFRKRLVEAGAEVLAPTNPYEKLRFRTRHGVGIVYVNAKGVENWNAESRAALDHLEAGKGSLSPVKLSRRRNQRAKILQLLDRDGPNCFFCGLELADDATIEHLVAIAHGGPNHISNLFLAHARCNQEAGHLSAPEKIAIAIEKRKAL